MRKLARQLACLAAATLVWTAVTADAEPTREPVRRALLIGINDYLANDLPKDDTSSQNWIPSDLRGAVNDVRLVEQVLRSRFGFVDADIETLTDRAATRKAVLEALERLARDARPGDTVYFHFSGHGSQVEDRNGDESDDGLDETILPHDARTGSVPDITDDELARALGRLEARDVLVVLDSCHSGTATRGGSAVQTRSVAGDRRSELYDSSAGKAAAATRGGDVLPEGSGYVLMTGASSHQSALDGPVAGDYYGLFSYSLARSLGTVHERATATEIHREAERQLERIGASLGLVSVPDSQLEAPVGLAEAPLLRGAGDEADQGPRLSWIEVRPEPSGQVLLLGGRDFGGAPGSTWAVYPPDETDFVPGHALAVATVTDVRNGDARARLDDGTTKVPASSRAVALAPAPGPDRVPVRLDRVAPELRASLRQAIRNSGAEVSLVEPGEFARFVVDVESGTCRVLSAGGLQEVASFAVSDANAVARRLATIFERSVHVSELLAVDNPTSRLTLEAHVLPIEANGAVRGIAMVGAGEAPAYRVRKEGEPRSRVNSLQVEITVGEDSFLTVVDIDPEGGVQVLFPNAFSERKKFHPGGFVRGGETIRLPDSLESSNRAGFLWDYAPPAGVDTLRVFAATERETSDRIREFVNQAASTVRGRGSIDPRSFVKELFDGLGPTTRTRGVRVVDAREEPDTESAEMGEVPAEPEPVRPAPDWIATTVTFVVEN